jgi:hypothetical protein
VEGSQHQYIRAKVHQSKSVAEGSYSTRANGDDNRMWQREVTARYHQSKRDDNTRWPKKVAAPEQNGRQQNVAEGSHTAPVHEMKKSDNRMWQKEVATEQTGMTTEWKSRAPMQKGANRNTQRRELMSEWGKRGEECCLAIRLTEKGDSETALW